VIILYIVMTYLSIGFLFSIVFVTRLIDRIDEAVQGASWTFRLMIIPGCVAFWPVLLNNFQKTRQGKK
jgi:hypothetical protein